MAEIKKLGALKTKKWLLSSQRHFQKSLFRGIITLYEAQAYINKDTIIQMVAADW